MTYRPDIDGLRAVAVLAVVIFHLNAAWLPGGFLGVDIFFVISGYLIGGILYRELTTHTFSLKRFYLRRMRRILPAFFAVVIFTLLVGSVLMVLPGFGGFTKACAKWSMVFIGNMFSATHTDYFTPEAEYLPLNHLWSLAVEEQFYFIYPLLLWGLMKILTKITPPLTKSAARSLEIILTLLAIVSFALAFLPVIWRGNTLIAYYLPQLRFGELLIGAILAVKVAQGVRVPRKKWATLIGTVSLVVLLICLVMEFPNETPWFPGFAAAIPCMASAGIIYAGGRGYWFSRILSHRAVVFVGKISYSLYLWHWVVLAFAHNVWGINLPPMLLTIVVLCIILTSLLSFYLIEQPLRHLEWGFSRSFVVYYLIPVAIVGWMSVWSNTKPKDMVLYMNGTADSLGKPLTDEALSYKVVGDTHVSDTTVLIMGNSHTLHLYNFAEKVGKKEGWKGVLSGVGAQFPMLNDTTTKISATDYQQELEHLPDGDAKGAALNILRSRMIATDLHKFNTVMISLHWWYYTLDMERTQIIMTTIDYLLQKGKKVVLINSCMEYPTDRMFETFCDIKGVPIASTWLLPDKCLHTQWLDEQRQRLDAIQSYVHRRFPTVRWLDLSTYLPPSLLLNDRTVLANRNHLNVYGANYLADRFIADGRRLIAPTTPQQSTKK